MNTPSHSGTPVKEGLRERKRRQTHERIVSAAIRLFLERGFDQVTVDDIAAAAEISPRAFFSYFAAKEDVVFAWQDAFGEALAKAVLARPLHEPLTRAVEGALRETLAAAIRPESLALDELIQRTPALGKRDAVKYARMEESLGNALVERAKTQRDRFQARLLAAIVAAGVKLASVEFRAKNTLRKRGGEAITKRVLNQLWDALFELGREGLNDQKPPGRKRNS